MSSNSNNNNVSHSNSVGPSIPAEENPEVIAAGIEGELERTPPGSDLETASSSNEAEPSNGFSQSEHPVFSLRRALIMPRRETGNIHSPTADVRHDHPGQIYNHHGSERGIQSDRIVGDSHKESRRTTILRYFPDLYYGHWSDTFLYATYVRTPSPLR